VIASKDRRPGPTTVPAARDDAQLTLLTAISAFADSIPPLIISRNQTFEKSILTERQLDEGHDYVIRNGPKTLRTEVLFIDWSKTLSMSRSQHFRAKYGYAGPIVL
jgi:hypothetical protein